jgi:hypothetical protein
LDLVLLGTSDNVNARAIGGGGVTISALSDPDTPLLGIGSNHQVDQSPQSSPFLDIDDPLSTKGFLGNGIYVVRGVLLIDVQIDEDRTTSGTVFSDFFDGEGKGLRVGVAAAPRVTDQSIIITSVYQSLLHRSPTDEEFASALAYLQAGGTLDGLRGRLVARFIPTL